MKINIAKQKMLQGCKPAFGYSAKLGSPVAAEFLGHSGADFVMLDGQHGSWGQDSLIQRDGHIRRPGDAVRARCVQFFSAHRPAARRGRYGHHRADGEYD